MVFHPIAAFFLFPIMIVLVQLGRRFRGTHPAVCVSSAVEGAVFALFGLLLAFTFSGAIARYDDHRKIVVEEANDIGVAYLRLDLLPAGAQPVLRQDFRDYAAIREHRFDDKPESQQSIEAANQTERLLRDIWTRSLAAADSPGASPVYRLLGAKDLGTTTFPPIGTALITGDLAFRQHTDGHNPAPNFPTFIAFASRYLKAPANP